MTNETTHHEDGIYIDLDEAEYHADPALGSGDIRNLAISPAHYWANSHLNPNRKTESTPAQIRGSAYHALVCEGENTFGGRYIRAFDKSEHPNALDTAKDLQKFVLDNGGTTKKKPANRGEAITRALDIDPNVEILSLLKRDYAVAASEKVVVKADNYDWIMYAYEALQSCEASKLFTGGTPEVSIFWTNDGIRCKSRIDYVTKDHALNLKTVTQMQKILMDEFIPLHIARERLHIQAYWEISALYRAGLSVKKSPEGFDDIGFENMLHALGIKLTKSLAPYNFVFQETGDNPAPFVRTFNQFSPGTEITNGYWRLAKEDVMRALRKFKTFQDFPTSPGSPWIEDTPARSLADEEFPGYFIAR